jgi:peptide/nickel transport system permease protein
VVSGRRWIRRVDDHPRFHRCVLLERLYYGTLPALTIVVSSIGGRLLGMRNMMVSTTSEDYVVTAEAKGLSPMRVLTRYAARNAALPSIAGFAISLGFVVGIGNALLQAVPDLPVVRTPWR